MSDHRAAALVLARAIAGGGRIHVVGTALPAEAVPPLAVVVPAPAAEDALREVVAIGDAVVVAGEVGGVVARDRILRRIPVWGAESVWIGRHARPYEGLARAVVEVDDAPAALAALAVAAVALAADPVALAPALAEREAEACITCSDEGRLGEVLAPPGGRFEPALVRTETGIEEVDTTLVGDVAANDLVLIHAGGAIARIPEPEHTVLGRMGNGVIAGLVTPRIEESR